MFERRSQILEDEGLAPFGIGGYIAGSPRSGPFVNRLGRQVFNLKRGVRFP